MCGKSDRRGAGKLAQVSTNPQRLTTDWFSPWKHGVHSKCAVLHTPLHGPPPNWETSATDGYQHLRVPTPAHFPSFLLWMEQTCHLCSLEEFLCPDPQLWHPTTSTLSCCEWAPNTSAAGPRWMYSAIQGQVEARLVSMEGVVRRLGDRTLCFKRIVVINCM